MLGVALIAMTIYSCRPADTSRQEAILRRCCEYHLRICGPCREAGLTPERMLSLRTPTVCVSFGPTESEADTPRVAVSP